MFAEDLSSVPNTQVKLFTVACNSSSRRLNSLFSEELESLAKTPAVHCKVTSLRMYSFLLWYSHIEPSADFGVKENAGIHPRSLRILSNEVETQKLLRIRDGSRAERRKESTTPGAEQCHMWNHRQHLLLGPSTCLHSPAQHDELGKVLLVKLTCNLTPKNRARSREREENWY